MKQYFITMLLAIACCVTAIAAEPDLIVTQNGESIKVYNLDISVGDKIYYTLEEGEDAPLLKINKSDVLVIKKADGNVVNPNQNSDKKDDLPIPKKSNPAAHEAVTHKAIENDFFIIEKKQKKNHPKEEEKYILVSDGNQQVLNMKVLSEEDKTLSVWAPRKNQKYELTEYIIPEYVMIGDDRYTVEEIGPKAFYKKWDITDIIFPETLKSIQQRAFSSCLKLRRIILPESTESICSLAFVRCGLSCRTFEQLYIPKGVKTIGENAFLMVGPNTSGWNGFFQGNLSCMPDFITTGNCTSYGIDEEAVEAYEKRKR